MQLSLAKADFQTYTSRQVNHFFPDKQEFNLSDYGNIFDLTLDRLNYCFQKVAFDRYYNNDTTLLNHLYSDHYLMYLWFLSNTFWKELKEENMSSKLYYLNKCMHGFDCMYNTNMPDIFLIFHGVGTMLGKADYSDYFIALHGCTVGSQKGHYPVFGKGVTLTANSSVIGKCAIGDKCTISTRTTIFQKDIPNNHTAFTNFETGKLQLKATKEPYAQQFFNVDLDKV